MSLWVKHSLYVWVQDCGLWRWHAAGCGAKLCQTLQLPEGVRTQWGAGLFSCFHLTKPDIDQGWTWVWHHRTSLNSVGLHLLFISFRQQVHLEVSGFKYLVTSNLQELVFMEQPVIYWCFHTTLFNWMLRNDFSLCRLWKWVTITLWRWRWGPWLKRMVTAHLYIFIMCCW